MDNNPDEKPKNLAFESFRGGETQKGYMRNRFFALVIDILVIVLLSWLMFILFKTPDWSRYWNTQDIVQGLTRDDPLVIERARLYQTCSIISLTIGAAYESLMLVLFRASLGKLIFRQRVVDTNENRSFVLGRLLLVVRTLIKMVSMSLLSMLPFIFMCLTAFGNSERRSGFDMFSGTKVVDIRRKKNENYGASPADGG